MSGPPKYDRKAEVKRIRKAGRIAAMDGRSRETNPYSVHSMDHYRWDEGWQAGKQYLDDKEAALESQGNLR